MLSLFANLGRIDTFFTGGGGGRVVEGKFAVMKYLIVSSHVGGRGLYISGVVCDDGSKYILYVSLLIFFYREEGWGGC